MGARPDVVNTPDAAAQLAADALGAALALVGAGWGVFPTRADTKRPARHDWPNPADGRPDDGYTTDAATVRAWWGKGGRYAKCGVGIALRDAGAFAIDLDDAEATDGWAAMVEAGGGIAPTFTVYSTKGAKVLLRRDGSPVPLDANGNKPRVPTFAGKTDIVGGYVLAWAPGRRWQGSPDVVAACPAWLHAPLSAIYAPAPRPAPTAPSTSSPAMPWGRTWTGAELLARQCDKVASTAEGGRNAALHAASCTVYGLAHIAPIIDRNAEADLLAAGRACGLGDRESLAAIRSGAKWGRANPLRLTDRPDDVAELDIAAAADVRAEAVAALAELRPDMAELRGLHHRRRVSVVRVVGTLLATVAESGRRDVVANLDDIATAADVGRKAIAAAADDLALLGWAWQPGDAVERRAGCFTWGGRLSAPLTHGRDAAGGRQDENTGAVAAESVAASVATPVGAAPDVLPLALRRPVLCLPDGTRRRAPRRRQGETDIAARLDACGQWAAEALAVVRAATGATGDDVADVLGISPRAARRTLANMTARGILTSSAAPSTGGRPAMIYAYAPAEGVLETERAVGLAIYARAVAAAKVHRDRLTEAKAEAAATGEALRVVLSRMKAADWRRVRAERTPAKERYERPVIVVGFDLPEPARRSAGEYAELDAVAFGRTQPDDVRPPTTRRSPRGSWLSLDRAAVLPPSGQVSADTFLAAIAL